MPKYVDGYVLPMPVRNVKKYQAIAKKASKIWKEHGALDYRECVGDDLESPWAMSFTKGIGTKKGETVVFAYVTYKNKAQRDKVNKAVMKDPRLAAMCDPKNMPFDCKRMIYGGFKTLVGS